MIVTSMKQIIGSIIFSQCSGKEWLLSEAIVDLVRIYTYCSGDDADEDVSKQLYTMVENRGKSQDAENLRSNLLEVHYKIQYRLKEKLTNILAPLFKIPAATKYHYWFTIFLDPGYATDLKDINTYHQSENVDTKIIVQQMMPKFYEYIMAEEISVNPNTPQILVGNNKESL